MGWTAAALGALMIGTTVLGWWWSRRPDTDPGVSRGGHPGWWLLAVTALIYLNQVLVTVYLLRTQHGDPTFIARYLPPGWFDVATGDPALRWLAAHWPAPQLLAVSVLRVPAALELPFVLFGYLTVCRWLGPGWYRRAVHLTWPIALSYTATFALIEWTLHNPYTTQDITIRALSALAVGLLVTRHTTPGADPPTSVRALLLFGISVAALAYLILAVYDTALLYNLAHLTRKLPRTAAALAVLAAARLLARRVHRPGPRPALTVVSDALGRFLVLFAVPALPIRYGLGFGLPVFSLLCCAALVLAAVITPAARAHWRVLTLATMLGLATAPVGLLLPLIPEARLLASAAAVTLTAITTCALADHAARKSAAARPTTQAAQTHQPGNQAARQ